MVSLVPGIRFSGRLPGFAAAISAGSVPNFRPMVKKVSPRLTV
jgi:hypothetical protein